MKLTESPIFGEGAHKGRFMQCKVHRVRVAALLLCGCSPLNVLHSKVQSLDAFRHFFDELAIASVAIGRAAIC